jgi:hypothetical protein
MAPTTGGTPACSPNSCEGVRIGGCEEGATGGKRQELKQYKGLPMRAHGGLLELCKVTCDPAWAAHAPCSMCT